MNFYTTKLACLIITFLVSVSFVSGQDTTVINAHESTDLTWHGGYDEWAEFPGESQQYREVKMTYDMGCASNDCSEWDYTTRVMAIKPTGRYDSTLKEWPDFKVNKQTRDSVKFRTAPTYQRYYDTQRQVVDSFKKDSLWIVKYDDPNNPRLATDTLTVWPAGYFKYELDNNGNRVDSQQIQADSTWHLTYSDYYDVYEIKRNIELASAITPYGRYMRDNQYGFDNEWQHEMVFDVTDFQALLSDSVKIRVFYDGWSSGFSASIDFHFIEGQPTKEVQSIKKLYQGHWDYKNASDFEQNKMPGVNVNLDQKPEQAKVRVIASGHGFDNNKNCAEFCKKNYFLNVNGSREATQLLWRDDCGMNPIYPQGGTWLLDRANWCPGTRVKVYEHDVSGSLQQGQNSLNIDMESITWSGEQAPSYHFAVQLITYKQNNAPLDASLEHIIAPSSHDEFARFNPVAMEPRVSVKNKGQKPINSIEFSYQAKGARANTYTWDKGTIAPFESKEIQFPAKVNHWRNGDTIFKVNIEEVNGEADDKPENNSLTSHFQAPPVLPHRFRVWFETNAQASQNRLFIKNAQGEVVYDKSDLEDNSRYKDTVELPSGYGEYKLVLADDDPNASPPLDENGLYYPFAPSLGRGDLSLRGVESLTNMIKDFNPDFGSKIVYHFTTQSSFWGSRDDQASEPDFTVSPNPSNGVFRVEFDQNRFEQLEVVNTKGKVMYETRQVANAEKRLKLGSLNPGIYLLKAIGEGDVQTEKLIIH